MSHTITLEVDETTFRAIEQEADRSGQPFDRVASAVFKRLTSNLLDRKLAEKQGKMSAEEITAARKSFGRWIGSVQGGDPSGSDNDRIDADLAVEYGRGLE